MTDGKPAALQEIYHYFTMRRYEQARDRIIPLLAHYPKDGELLYLLAYCLYGLELYEEALAACIDAFSSGYSPEDCNLLLGRIYFDLRRYTEAEEALLTTLGINPVNAEAIAVYSYLMLAAGYDRKAAALMEEALRLDPHNEEVRHFNFMSLILTGKGDQQLPALRQFLQTSDNEVNMLINTGIYEWARKNFKSARESFRQAFLLNPTDKNILAVLKEFDEITHPLFLPNRLVAKFTDFGLAMGGFWGLLFIGGWMGETGHGDWLLTMAGFIVLFGILLVIHTVLATFIYGVINKIRGA
jgi:tetratricopeptide (TPR) repeat protein